LFRSSTRAEPDLEVPKLSERCGFSQHVPTYLGDIQYLYRGQEPGGRLVLMAQGFTSERAGRLVNKRAAFDSVFDRFWLTNLESRQRNVVG